MQGEGRGFAAHGEENPVLAGVVAALRRAGLRPEDARPDVLLLSYPLLLGAGAPARGDLLDRARAAAAEGCARILFLLPAVAGLPARRYPEHSAAGAAVLAEVRGLAMRFAPDVLVNAVGVGTIVRDGALVAGDMAFLAHASVPRPGTIEEVAAAAVFLCDPRNSYTTGQFLAVDGGWMAGYGRNF